MYEELIKQLRETSIDFGESDHVSVMLIEAADAIEDLITALTASNEVIAKNKPKWIPVTERLPEPQTDVLAAWDNGEVWTVYQWWAEPKEGEDPLEYDDDIFYENGEFYSTKKRVTHWMPLPQPPESEGE